MVNKCVVRGCPTRGPKHKYFSAPFTNIPRWKVWATICPYLENIPFIKRGRIRFCAKHFLPDHINEKKKLKPNAIPLLHLEEIESNIQLAIEPTDNSSEPYNFDLITRPCVRLESDSQPPCTDLDFSDTPQPVDQIQEIVPCIVLNFDDIRLTQHTTEISYTSFCICCLESNSCVVDLTSCSHKDFLKNFSIPDFKPHNPVVCFNCHSLLKKINEFQQQVRESFKMLSEETFSPPETNTRLKIEKTVDELINPNDIETVHLPSYAESTEDIHTPESVRLKNIQTALDIINSNNASPILGLLSGINELNDVLGSVGEDLSRNFQGSDSPDVDFITTPSAGEHAKTETNNKNSPYLDVSREPKKKYLNPIKKVKLTKKQLMRERYCLSSSKAYLKYPYRCKDCIQGFKYKENYENHVRRKHNVTLGSKCEICLQYLPDQILDVHKSRHFVRYLCSQCNKKYRSRDEATYHYSKHHTLRTNTHTQTHSLTCPHCGLVCHTQTKLCWHVKVRHKMDSQETPQLDPTESHNNDSYCSKCDVEFKTSHTCFDEYSDLIQELSSVCG